MTSQDGFFIPYRFRSTVSEIAYPACGHVLGAHIEAYRNVIGMIETFETELANFGGAPPAPRFEQDWFARLDAAACYTIIRKFAPKRIIEVGSGHSTRVMMRAIEDGGLDTRLTCIDPKPRAALLDLDVRHLSALAKDVDAAVFDQLQSGDVLFIDSSHLAQPGTDVDFLLNSIVPRLDSGAIIHIHDVVLPDPYPEIWHWRGYNEQLIVAQMLTGGGFEPLFSSHFTLNHTDLIKRDTLIDRLPLMDGALETSLWLAKRTKPIR